MNTKKVELHPEIKLGEDWGGVPYEERQVYAAANKVHVDLCKACNFLKRVEGGPGGANDQNDPRNSAGQIGTCCYCRHEASEYKMKGKGLCVEPVTK